jgi:hypothetical protein
MPVLTPHLLKQTRKHSRRDTSSLVRPFIAPHSIHDCSRQAESRVGYNLHASIIGARSRNVCQLTSPLIQAQLGLSEASLYTLIGSSMSRAITDIAGCMCWVDRWPTEGCVLNANRGVVDCHVRVTAWRLGFGRCRQVELSRSVCSLPLEFCSQYSQ